MLKKRYGYPRIVLASYPMEVRNWLKLKFDYGNRFRMFYNFLVKYDGEVREHCWNAVNTPDILCMLVSKLPNGLIDKWNIAVYNIHKNHVCEPSLSDLTEFMDQETTLVNDPMFSREEIENFS